MGDNKVAMQALKAQKGVFKTRWHHRRIPALFKPERKRAPGYRKAPVLVRLDPKPGITPSDKPVVRIYIGTEPEQYRAERVLIWSVMQVRDPARSYEIFLMKDLEGFDRSTWKTGFTNYRYAIPGLAGGQGRAIYNDVDQIYFGDPAALFDSDMKGAAVLSINEKETSVMLLDCDKLNALWPLSDAQKIHSHKKFRSRVHDAGLWGNMSPVWNSRDHEYLRGESKLLHFTTLHTQPWRPFPDKLKYWPHKQARLWEDLECSANQNKFTIFANDRPSERYNELIAMYTNMHEHGRPDTGHDAEKTFSGISLTEHISAIGDLVKKNTAKSVLDYGSGKGKLYQDAPGHPGGSRFKTMADWGGAVVTCYDPGYEPFSGPLEDKYDGVITTDVVEHIPEEDIGWILDKLFAYAQSFVYVVAACYPANKRMPDGSNAHCTIQPPQWWRGQMELAARRNPGISWVLCAQQKGIFAFQQRKALTKKGIRNRYFAGKSDKSEGFGARINVSVLG